jgi:hypothetical protein
VDGSATTSSRPSIASRPPAAPPWWTPSSSPEFRRSSGSTPDGIPTSCRALPYTAFAIEITTGFFGAFPPRPFVADSDRQWHAFVITGANGKGVFINNSNDTWSGSHPFLTWDEFKTWTCKLADKDDPSKGCSTEANQDLATLNILGRPRPETERRGSISLRPDSVQFFDSFDRLLSTSSWSGFYGGGYAFSDQDGFGRIPYDATYNHAIPSSALLFSQFYVVTTSSLDASYEIATQLLVDGVGPAAHIETATISALSQTTIIPYNGVFSLNDSSTVNPCADRGHARHIVLRRAAWCRTKRVGFRSFRRRYPGGDHHCAFSQCSRLPVCGAAGGFAGAESAPGGWTSTCLARMF